MTLLLEVEEDILQLFTLRIAKMIIVPIRNKKLDLDDLPLPFLLIAFIAALGFFIFAILHVVGVL